MKLIFTAGLEFTEGATLGEDVDSALRSKGVSCVSMIEQLKPGDRIIISVLKDGGFSFDMSLVHAAEGVKGAAISQR